MARIVCFDHINYSIVNVFCKIEIQFHFSFYRSFVYYYLLFLHFFTLALLQKGTVYYIVPFCDNNTMFSMYSCAATAGLKNQGLLETRLKLSCAPSLSNKQFSFFDFQLFGFAVARPFILTFIVIFVARNLMKMYFSSDFWFSILNRNNVSIFYKIRSTKTERQLKNELEEFFWQEDVSLCPQINVVIFNCDIKQQTMATNRARYLVRSAFLYYVHQIVCITRF